MADETVNEAPKGENIFDMHDAYMMARECGLGSEVTLEAYSVQTIASRLRGINGIAAVLMTDTTDVHLGDFIRCALVEAVNALAQDCIEDIEQIHNRQAGKRVAA